MVTVAVGRESAPGERRVALVPDSVGRLTRAGVEVRVETGAGAASYFADQAYVKAGASIVDASALTDGAAVLVRVQRPSPAEVDRMPAGSTLIALLQPGTASDIDAPLARRSISALALERVPRITRAQSMDVLSSQSTVAGYKAVLIAASELAKFLPMLTTAAGAIPPAKVLVIGAGVAGLQAIATAKRLGAQVYGFDIRAAAAEQVRSLGATFIADAPPPDAEAAGGYARAQSDEEQQQTLRTIAAAIGDMDIVISTAQIPGRAAPRLITAEMVESMRPGSVIIDLAAETGGNCELTRAGEETASEVGVRVIGPVNLPATIPLHASQMFSRNVLTLLQHMIRDGELHVDVDDEIVGPMLVTAPAATAS